MLKKMMSYAVVTVLAAIMSMTIIGGQVKGFLNEKKEAAEAVCFDERLDLDDLPVDMMETFQEENFLGCRDLDETYDEFGIHRVGRAAFDVSDQTDEFKVIEFLIDPDAEKIIGWEVFDYVPSGICATSL